MRSTFGGLSVANSALAAQRRALDAAGHNIANANTPGYSRQRLDLGSAQGGSSMIHTGTVIYGGGVNVTGQSRIVDAFLIQRANDERTAKGLADEMRMTYSRLESLYNEPGEFGMGAQLEAFWDAWDAVAIAPHDLAARSALLQRGIAVGDHMQDLSRSFEAMSADVLQRAEAVAVQINGLASQIASLNNSIVSASNAGVSPNDLLDQRDELVRELSTLTGVRTRVDDVGRMDVSIGGTPLVSGVTANTVSLDTSTPGAAALRVSTTTVPLAPHGGQMEGLLRSANIIIPQQQQALDAIADQLRGAVNAVHHGGQGLEDPPVGDIDFFQGTGAADFRVNADLLLDPGLVRAGAAGEGRYGNGNAIAMAEIGRNPEGPDARYRAMIAQLGVDAQTAIRRSDLQNRLTADVDQQREAVSGVSLDEEMSNMIAFQQAYQASARYMTAVDEMLNTLIRGTGLVGR